MIPRMFHSYQAFIHNNFFTLCLILGEVCGLCRGRGEWFYSVQLPVLPEASLHLVGELIDWKLIQLQRRSSASIETESLLNQLPTGWPSLQNRSLGSSMFMWNRWNVVWGIGPLYILWFRWHLEMSWHSYDVIPISTPLDLIFRAILTQEGNNLFTSALP